jgi:hypothetical protein
MYVLLNDKYYKIHKRKEGGDFITLRGKRKNITASHVVVERKSKKLRRSSSSNKNCETKLKSLPAIVRNIRRLCKSRRSRSSRRSKRTRRSRKSKRSRRSRRSRRSSKSTKSRRSRRSRKIRYDGIKTLKLSNAIMKSLN